MLEGKLEGEKIILHENIQETIGGRVAGGGGEEEEEEDSCDPVIQVHDILDT